MKRYEQWGKCDHGWVMYSSCEVFILDSSSPDGRYSGLLLPLRMFCGPVSTPVTNPLPLPTTVTDVGCTSAAVLGEEHRARLACTGSGSRCCWGWHTLAVAAEALQSWTEEQDRRSAQLAGTGSEASCYRRPEQPGRRWRQRNHRCGWPLGLRVGARPRQQPCGRPPPASYEPSTPFGSL